MLVKRKRIKIWIKERNQDLSIWSRDERAVENVMTPKHS
jgi:hypothetical protein